MIRRQFLTAVSGVAVTGLVAGCAGNTGETATETADDTTTNETTSGTEETTTGDGDGTDIDGEIADAPTDLEVTNRETDGEVGLRGTFVDESEEELTEGLEPGDSWEFDVVLEEANVDVPDPDPPSPVARGILSAGRQHALRCHGGTGDSVKFHRSRGLRLVIYSVSASGWFARRYIATILHNAFSISPSDSACSCL